MKRFHTGYLYIDKVIREFSYPPNLEFIVLGSDRVLHNESRQVNIYDFNGNIIGGPFWRVSCCNAFNYMTAIGLDNETSFFLDINANSIYTVLNYELAAFSDDIVIRTEGINKSGTFADLFSLSTKKSFRRCVSYYSHGCSLFYEGMNNIVYFIEDLYGDNDCVLRDCLFGTSIRSFPESSIITYRTSEKDIVAFDKIAKENILKLPSQYSIKYINDKFCILENLGIEKCKVYTFANDGLLSDVFSERFFSRGLLC